MSNLRKTSQGVDTVTFANPNAFNDTFRVIVKPSVKRVGQVSVNHIRSTILSLTPVVVAQPEGCCSINMSDQLSIRTQISGARENAVQVAKMLDQHIANLQVIRTDIINGFVPFDATLPILG